MGAPLKPWEMNMNNGIVPSSSVYVSNTNPNRLYSSAIPYPGSGGGGIMTNTNASGSGVPPPLPPRSAQTRPLYSAYNRSTMMPYSTYGGSGGYGSPYTSYYGGGPSYSSGYGSYGLRPYGNRPMGYGYGNHGDPSLSQIAEESASPAFQSIESFVGAFCSISAMLESTFHALYSSFRAVVGVADHLGRLKQILSALTIFRLGKWVIRRFLYLVGISKIKPEDVESLWNNLTASDNTGIGDVSELVTPRKPSSWPIFMFLGFIFAGPYLMWKLVKSLNLDPDQKDKRKWATGETEHFIAVVQYPFEPMNDRELEVKPGQVIRLAPSKFQPAEVRGWVLASDGVRIGLVPTNYIKIKGKKSRDPGPLPLSISIPQPQGSQSQHSTPERTHGKIDGSHVLSDEQISDAAGMSSDDDTDTLVGEPVGGE